MNMFSRMNVRVAAGSALLLGLLWLAPQPVGAVDREHQQLMADIRMLQEQSQQLRALLGDLSEAIKAVSAKIDDQTGITRKAFADEKVVVDAISGSIREIREKVDETNTRLGSMSQEMEALRLAIPPSIPVAPSASDSATPGSTTPPQPAPPTPIGPGASPQKMFDTAMADYFSGQYSLAVSGFEAMLRAYPRAVSADQAQFYIGEAYISDGRYADAVAAYGKMIANYPDSAQLAQAYYKQGLAYDGLKQPEDAKQAWETVVSKFPDSTAASLAKQGLDRLSRAPR
jgi:tol-pal system protein YbgF